jgi:hypothetical protein
MPTALRVSPPDDDEFLAVEAFRLQPRAPTGLIPTINALRDNAFEAALADQAMDGRALAYLMIVVPQRLRRTDQERLQPSLAVHQREVADVFAIQEQQIEQEKDQRSLASVGRVLDQVEGRFAIGQHPAEFAVQVGVLRR